MRNICDACEHCVFTSRDIRFCIDHCDMVEHIIADLEYKRNKNRMSLYGSSVADVESDCIEKYHDTLVDQELINAQRNLEDSYAE